MLAGMSKLFRLPDDTLMAVAMSPRHIAVDVTLTCAVCGDTHTPEGYNTYHTGYWINKHEVQCDPGDEDPYHP